MMIQCFDGMWDAILSMCVFCLILGIGIGYSIPTYKKEEK